MPKFRIYIPSRFSIEAVDEQSAIDKIRQSPGYFKAVKLGGKGPRSLKELLQSETRNFTPKEQLMLDKYNTELSDKAQKIASSNSSPRISRVK